MDFTPPFGQWLKQQRQRLDLTQGDLARRLGYSPETLRKVEAGALKPSKQLLDLLADRLGVPASQRDAFLAFATGARTTQSEPAPSNVPAPANPLIGRAKEVVSLKRLLAGSQASPRLITLVGPPGVGKTRLALEAAREVKDAFPDGAWWVELAPVTDPQTALTSIAQALEIEDRPGKPILRVLQDHLRDKSLLLALDNLEQVLDVAPLIGQVLSAAPKLKVLTTSREVLRVSGEQVYAIEPLADDAVTLFVQRARAVKPGFVLTESNRETVAAICRKLDGLPLAIELAAARATLFTPVEMLARLDQRLSLLTGGARDVPPRQRTLRATLDWSYSLLLPNEQVLFRRLAVFANAPTASDIESVCSDDSEHSDLIDSLAALVSKSIMRCIIDPSGTTRYAILETIREYALNKLSESGEFDLRMHRLTEHLVAETEGTRKWHADDQDNWRAVLRWAVASTDAVDLAMRLSNEWDLFAISPREAQDWLEKLCTREDSSAASVARVRALTNWGGVLSHLGRRKQAQAIFEEALILYRAHHLTLDVAATHYMRGHIARELGNVQLSRVEFRECLQQCHSEFPQFLHWVLFSMAETEVVGEDVDAAYQLMDESLNYEPYHPYGQDYLRAWWLNHMAHIFMLRGNFAAARKHLDQSLNQYSEVAPQGNWIAAWNFQSLGEVALHER